MDSMSGGLARSDVRSRPTWIKNRLSARDASTGSTPMKVFISADMEGVCGVTHRAQCTFGHPDYPRFRRLLTEEVNAAAEGALAAGGTEVVVNDSHAMMTNLLIEKLHPEVSLIAGSNKPLCQMQGIDESFGCVFFIGYHQGDGQGDGIINHTLMSSTIREVRLNGEIVDEALINAAVAADFGVPVALITGDQQVCGAVAAQLPGIETAAVKQAIDRLSAHHLPLAQARTLIRERAHAAVKRAGTSPLPVFAITRPVTLDVEFRSSSCANMCGCFRDVARTGPCSLRIERETMADAYRLFWGVGIVGMAVLHGVFGSGL